jgi:hypothetical protein
VTELPGRLRVRGQGERGGGAVGRDSPVASTFESRHESGGEPASTVNRLGIVTSGMALGPLGSPPGLLLGLIALLVVLLVGRVLLSLAWKLVVIALVVVGALWLLGLVGLTDVLTATPVA